MSKQWDEEEDEHKNAKIVSSYFPKWKDEDKEKTEDEEGLWTKVKRWLKSKSGIAETIAEEMKKSQKQLTPPKK